MKNNIERFEKKEIGVSEFRNTLLENGNALEAMPYSMVKELDDLEYKLTISQFYEEEGCDISPSEAIVAVKNWVGRIPE